MSNDFTSKPATQPEVTRGSAVPATDFLHRPLWYWPEIADAVGAPLAAGGSPVTGISIDSRSLKPGDLFIALSGDPGERFFTSSPGTRDGHDFLRDAQSQGAAGALVAQTQPLGLAQLRCADTLDALWALGRGAVARHRGQRIAVTGSSGKTTAKAFLAAALGATAESGSLNNFWGVPLCLARTPIDARYGIFEIGTNQVGEIGPLSELVRPDVALLLNVHPAHLGNFSSFQALRQEKLSISNGLRDISTLVCESAVAAAANLTGRVHTFGDQKGSMVQLQRLSGDSATFETPGGTLTARVPGGGRHRALTLAGVVAVLIALGEDPTIATELPANLVPQGRGDEHQIKRNSGGEWLLIDDSYNANPASMTAALVAIADPVSDKVDTATEFLAARPAFALLGEMLELGDHSADFHRDLLQHCAGLTGIFCVGKNMRGLADALPAEQLLGYADSAAEIDLPELLQQLPASGRLLVKGSNSVFWQSNFVATLATAISRA